MTNPWNAEQPFDYSNVWPACGPIMRSMCRRLSGDESVWWHQYVVDRYIAPAIARDSALRCLVLGSSEGVVERKLCEAGFSGEIVASDIADKALDRARRQAAELGYPNIRHLQADLNVDRFDGHFDFIIAEGVLHHVERIERCLRMLDRCLAPNGYLIAAEFVGPVRFQLPDHQVAWINAMLAMLPAGLRPPLAGAADPFVPAAPEQHAAAQYRPPTVEFMLEFDPSEAICGPMLGQLLPERFELVERVELGGTLTTYPVGLLDYVKAGDPEWAPFMEAAIRLEDSLIDRHILGSDYVFFVARRRSPRGWWPR